MSGPNTEDHRPLVVNEDELPDTAPRLAEAAQQRRRYVREPMPKDRWGCSRRCSEQHTYVWGQCEAAVDPGPPPLMVAETFTASDGQSSIAVRPATDDELAARRPDPSPMLARIAELQATVDRLHACAAIAGHGVDPEGYYVGTAGWRLRALEALAQAAEAWEDEDWRTVESHDAADALSAAVVAYRLAKEMR